MDKVDIFKGQKIRRVIYQKEWWFSVVDVCGALTDSADSGAYWRKLKQRLKEEGSEVVTFCHGLKLEAPDGKKYETDCANTEGIFRIIQSVPSPKAEPFKRWLARVGYERVQEIEDPELATKRTGGKVTDGDGNYWKLGINTLIAVRDEQDYNYLKNLYDRTNKN